MRQQVVESGLVVGSVETRPDETPAGIVIEQSIAPNTTVTEGTEISFVISSGPAWTGDGGDTSTAGGEMQP